MFCRTIINLMPLSTYEILLMRYSLSLLLHIVFTLAHIAIFLFSLFDYWFLCRVGFRVRYETPEEHRRMHRPKCYEYSNKDDDNSSNTLNDKNYHGSTRIFRQITTTKLVECSPMVRKTWVQSQVESYQRFLKWYLIPPCLTLS